MPKLKRVMQVNELSEANCKLFIARVRSIYKEFEKDRGKNLIDAAAKAMGWKRSARESLAARKRYHRTSPGIGCAAAIAFCDGPRANLAFAAICIRRRIARSLRPFRERRRGSG